MAGYQTEAMISCESNLVSAMAQFGNAKVPPPWQQQRAQAAPQVQTSLLGQHPVTGTPQAGPGHQQLVIGGAPQQPQYTPVQQSMIQPPGLGGLQSLGQPTIPTAPVGQPATGASLMGQPPITTQTLQPPGMVNPTQLTNSQIQPQIQAQVTTVSYPTPRALAPPGSFNPPAAANNVPQQPQKQRVFTGTITKLCADFGFVDEDVFFQTSSCVKGQLPKVGDRVLVEASYNPNMPFKWNANRVQVIPGPNPVTTQASRASSASREQSRTGSYNAVPPPTFNNDNSNSSTGFTSRIPVGSARARSPRRERHNERREREREREREDKEKEEKRESRKRSRSRGRSRSPPPRRRPRIIPRYNVQVPKIMLHMKEANVLELKKRYSNLYVPSDVFLARPLWSDTFPAHRPFQLPRPVSFHIMNKEVDPVLENDTIYDPPDANHAFAAKVMLMAIPPLEDLFRRSCALSEDPSDVRECFVHPTRLINFLVGLKGKNETMAIGGYWSPSLDGANPEKDPNVLIHTAIRTCKALTGIDLTYCTTWYRFAEIYYRRGESAHHKGRSSAARVETTVLFLPDVWNVCPTKLEWDGLHLNYKRQLDKRLVSSVKAQQDEDPEMEEEEEDKEEPQKKDPSHWSTLDPKTMKVMELRMELDARMLNSKGLKSQLIARLTKILKAEQEKEEAEKAANAEKIGADEAKRKEEEEKKKEEERKKKEEEEKKKEEEEKRKAEERERTLLEKRYTLPEQPMIVVHPSRTAKSGKFDCTTMSLSVLLDYRQEDNKEHSFEVSLFAELFNEMLMRDFAFRIYRALAEAPEKPKDEKKEKEKEKDKEKDKKDKDKKDEKKDDKDKKEDKDEKKDEDSEDKEEKKDDMKCDTKEEKSEKEDKDDKEDKKEDENDDDEEMEEDEEYMDDEDSKDGSVIRTGDKDKDSKDSKDIKKRDSKKEREKREKREKKTFTVDPYLLLSFVYFDQTHTGYIIDRDVEEIVNMLGLNLSRAQIGETQSTNLLSYIHIPRRFPPYKLKRLMLKVMSRDVLHYRKLTDLPLEEKDKIRDFLPTVDLEILAQGNNSLLPVFLDAVPVEKSMSKKNTKGKEEINTSGTGLIMYEGSLVDVGKLLQQLERSDKARSDTEEKLKELQKDLALFKEEVKKSSDKSSKLTKEIKSANVNLKSMEEELRKAQEDNCVYQRALNQIKTVIKPLVTDVDMEEEEGASTKEESKDVKIKPETVVENGNCD
ncbi:cell division cycle and apoptosis regulator protein 1-like isoform X3 [Oratosquilla oratoria]|uniref:cell division cycle and apoptosis regulator protein 1-like isoform X3 n=1 Tax=Oratosquilla oratoria TaxID=337810 RepID=UPI003F761CF6